MSAWPIPDEVVRELARFVVVECLGATEECVVPSDFDRARAFLTRHRLAVIPEGHGVVRLVEAPPFEPSWDLDDDLDRIPGQPITVDKEERDGDE